MTNYHIETEFTMIQKCCKCKELIDEGLIKTNKTREHYFCPEHGIAEIRREINVLEHKAIQLARMIDNENPIELVREIERRQCVECNELFAEERDIQLCDKCIDKFDLDGLFAAHDGNYICALDFNEHKKVREKWRKPNDNE